MGDFYWTQSSFLMNAEKFRVQPSIQLVYWKCFIDITVTSFWFHSEASGMLLLSAILPVSEKIKSPEEWQSLFHPLLKMFYFSVPWKLSPEQIPEALGFLLYPHAPFSSSAQAPVPFSQGLFQHLSCLDAQTVTDREEIPGDIVWWWNFAELGVLISSRDTENIQENTQRSIAGHLSHTTGVALTHHKEGILALILSRPRGKETGLTMMK